MAGDIFDNSILCRKCGKIMKPELISRNGFNLRCVKCTRCCEAIVHPADKMEYGEFMRLKQKDFNVKMRMVGNSYAVSIPREIVDFMSEQEKRMNNMVKLCFEDMGRLSLNFNMPKMAESHGQGANVKSRVVRAKEVKIVRNNKPVLHTRQFYDSAHPERNKKVIKINKLGKNAEQCMEDDR